MMECINHEENNKISTYKYQLLLECNPIIRQIYIYLWHNLDAQKNTMKKIIQNRYGYGMGGEGQNAKWLY